MQDLMTNPHSPIVDFYPPGFEVDMEGKRAEWEAIVLIPFIHQQRLLAAEASIPPGSLTEAERSRNQPGSILIFSHDANAVDGMPPSSLWSPCTPWDRQPSQGKMTAWGVSLRASRCIGSF